MIAPLPDFGLIAGETVTVRTPTVGYDEHMEEVVTWQEATVANVVVTPGATSDVLDSGLHARLPQDLHGALAWLSRARARHRMRRHRRPAALHG